MREPPDARDARHKKAPDTEVPGAWGSPVVL